MTATQMLTEALNGALRRPAVDGAKLRAKLIKQGVIKSGRRWVYVRPGPNRRAELVWTATS